MKEILTPTLLLDWKIASSNIQKMLGKANQNKLLLRPHFKTPQSKQVGRKCRAMGIKAITVSSIAMAEYFAADGWDDITIAFPVNVRRQGRYSVCPEKFHLTCWLSTPKALVFLKQPFPGEVGVFIKIDVGTHRTGLAPDDDTTIQFCLKKIAATPSLVFKGFLAHAGHSYSARSKKEIMAVHKSSTAILNKLKKKYSKSHPHLIVSTGDTLPAPLPKNGQAWTSSAPAISFFTT